VVQLVPFPPQEVVLVLQQLNAGSVPASRGSTGTTTETIHTHNCVICITVVESNVSRIISFL
jgi:hypothetical protein